MAILNAATQNWKLHAYTSEAENFIREHPQALVEVYHYRHWLPALKNKQWYRKSKIKPTNWKPENHAYEKDDTNLDNIQSWIIPSDFLDSKKYKFQQHKINLFKWWEDKPLIKRKWVPKIIVCHITVPIMNKSRIHQERCVTRW